MSTDVASKNIHQLTTFSLGSYKYGIDVMRVQEVTNTLSVTKIPIAPAYVRGLVNLRGQIATAIGLHELFGIAREASQMSNMTVICKVDGTLLSLFVDGIGDVVQVDAEDLEPVPPTIQGGVRNFMGGVYKTKDEIISVIDLDKMARELNQALDSQK